MAPRTGPTPLFCSDACKQACWRHRRRLSRGKRQAFDHRRRWEHRWWQTYGAQRAQQRAHFHAQEMRWRREEQRWEREHAARSRLKQETDLLMAADARARIFELAGLTDDAAAPALRSVWRTAAQRHHPDHGGAAETMRELLTLKLVLGRTR